MRLRPISRPATGELLCSCFVACLIWAALSLLLPLAVHAEPLRLSSLEWPPHVGPDLPGQGRVAERVRRVCDAAGFHLELSFAPWKRVLLSVQAGTSQGYFPEYRSAEREKRFLYSRPVGCSVIGLVHRGDADFRWTRLEDLAQRRIGVVDGYVNTEEFDRLAAQGVLQIVPCNTDTLALRMVRAGRIDAAVMDRDVFRDLAARADPQDASDLAFHPRILTVHTLHVCFPRTPEGRRFLERFDRAVSELGAAECLPLPD